VAGYIKDSAIFKCLPELLFWDQKQRRTTDRGVVEINIYLNGKKNRLFYFCIEKKISIAQQK